MSIKKHKYINGRSKDKDIFSDDLKELGIDNEDTGNWILIYIFLIPVLIFILCNVNYGNNAESMNNGYKMVSENIYFQIICVGFITIMLLLYFVDFIKNRFRLKKDKWQIDINKRLPRFIIWVIITSIVIFFYFDNISKSISNTQLSPNMNNTIIITGGVSLSILLFLGNWILKSDLYEGLGEKSETNKYNANDYEVTYHDSVDDLISQNSIIGVTRVVDPSGNLVELKGPIEKTPPYFNSPSIYKYGINTYVPNYEESVYLSKTHGVQQKHTVNNVKSSSYPSSNFKFEETD